jgi:hypothetical protein
MVFIKEMSIMPNNFIIISEKVAYKICSVEVYAKLSFYY